MSTLRFARSHTAHSCSFPSTALLIVTLFQLAVARPAFGERNSATTPERQSVIGAAFESVGVARATPPAVSPRALPSSDSAQTPHAGSLQLYRAKNPASIPEAGSVSAGWEILLSENFEGTWPGGWETFDMNYASGSDYWDRVDCAPAGGGSAVWCAATGDKADCGPSYDDNMRSWMIWGPFNLSDATAAEAQFDFMNDSEFGFDSVGFLFSTDGVQFSGTAHWGTTTDYPNTWRHEIQNLRDVSLLGDLANEPLVWMGILFESDSAESAQGGAYVDNIVIQTQRANGCTVTPSMPLPNAEICFPQTFGWSQAGDCDGLWMAFTDDPSSESVIVIPVTGAQHILERWQWAKINLFIGSGATYHWTIGEVFGEYFFNRTSWQPFSVCLPCPATGACCTPHPTAGCDDAACCESVCTANAFCCEFSWDATCSVLASQLCGCLLCGNGNCNDDETCAICPADCSYTGSPDDCNSNGVPDGCDIQTDSSDDCNRDGIPDECLGTVCPPYFDNDAFTSTDTTLFRIDLATGEEVSIGVLTGLQFIYALAIDPTNGDLYGIDRNNLAIIDPEDASVQIIGPHSVFMLDTRRGLGFDNVGNLFLIHDSSTYTVDKATGATTLLGSNSLNDATALTFSSDGDMFAVGEVPSQGGLVNLVRLDPSTGALAEVIGVMPSGIGGLDFDSRGVLYATDFIDNTVYAVSRSDASSRVISTFALGGSSLAIFRDCNNNANFDPHDITTGFSQDLNGDGIPDECDYCANGTCEAPEDVCVCPEDCGNPSASEVVAASCDDGLDNDCDGDFDCDDVDCTFDESCLPPPTKGGPGDMIIVDHRIDGVTGHPIHRFFGGADLQNPGTARIGPDGKLYILSKGNRAVVKFNLERGYKYGFFVESQSGGLNSPIDMIFGPDGHLYILEFGQKNVLRFDGSTGAFIDKFVANGAGGLYRPRAMTFGPDGDLYISSVDTHSILRFDGQTGAYIADFVPPQGGGLLAPYGLTFGPDGNLYVTFGATEGAVYRFDGTTGAFMDIFVQNYLGVFRNPRGIAFGPSGDLYVSSDIGQILRFDGSTGAMIEGAAFFSGDHLIFQPGDCLLDSDCDDADPMTEDICFGYECKHPKTARYYVDASANGLNDGSTWVNALTDLQDALAAARMGVFPVEIWVAAGVYTPDRGSGDRLATFELFDGLSLYGGFFGGETSIDQRQPNVNFTVLSGDLIGDDADSFVNYGDNSYHVVTASGSGFDAPTLIDGCVITGGNADGPDWEEGHRDMGGGLFSLGGNPTIIGCTFVANRATFGGAIRIHNSSRVNILNTQLIGNEAFFAGRGTGGGGGISSDNNIYFTITNVAFTGNTAVTGGAAYLQGRSTLTSCTVTNNQASGEAGGIYNTEAFTHISHSILWGNSDTGGSDESAQLGGANWRVHNCCVQGWTGNLNGEDNSGTCLPLFVNAVGRDASAGTIDDNLRLMPESPNIDTETSLTDIDMNRAGIQRLPSVDLDGLPRVSGGQLDRGAYEFQMVIPTDCNYDGIVNLLDHATFTACLLGPNGGINAGSCSCFDVHGDGHVTLSDYAQLQAGFTGE